MTDHFLNSCFQIFTRILKIKRKKDEMRVHRMAKVGVSVITRKRRTINQINKTQIRDTRGDDRLFIYAFISMEPAWQQICPYICHHDRMGTNMEVTCLRRCAKDKYY